MNNNRFVLNEKLYCKIAYYLSYNKFNCNASCSYLQYRSDFSKDLNYCLLFNKIIKFDNINLNYCRCKQCIEIFVEKIRYKI